MIMSNNRWRGALYVWISEDLEFGDGCVLKFYQIYTINLIAGI